MMNADRLLREQMSSRSGSFQSLESPMKGPNQINDFIP